ncbi:metal-dependent hydrolase [Natrinema sp. H-ect1]|uniref:metal-dependent hydrolase n=1 Tax=Natrinema sp. H-ect1 TaxID=3242700 RepID=UPI00359EB82C
MWPWEHLAVAYVLYSLAARAIAREPPSACGVLAVAVGSQFPDLLDKPLAWTVGLTDAGYSVGHSIFVAPIVCLGAYAVAARWGRRTLAGAFSIAYLSHPFADLLSQLLRDGAVDPRTVLWPIASPPATAHGGFLDHLGLYVGRYVTLLLAGGMTLQVLFQVLLGLAVFSLWVADGAPVAADMWRLLRARRAR